MEYLLLLTVDQQVLDCSGALAQIMRLVNTVLMVIYVAVPIILIIMGSIDLIKAILQSDDKKMKEAQSLLWKRLMYGALIFFLGIIIQFVVFDVILSGDNNESLRNCWRNNQRNAQPTMPTD